jgi:hypothetical protein
MDGSVSHCTFVIGASDLADQLRRSLVQRKIPHAGVTTHLRGLRHSLVRGEHDVTVVCIAMDDGTLDRFGDELRSILMDYGCVDAGLCSIGLLPQAELTPEAASVGCNVFVHGIEKAVDAIEALQQHWVKRSDLAAVSDRHTGASMSDERAWTFDLAGLPRGGISIWPDPSVWSPQERE